MEMKIGQHTQHIEDSQFSQVSTQGKLFLRSSFNGKEREKMGRKKIIF